MMSFCGKPQVLPLQQLLLRAGTSEAAAGGNESSCEERKRRGAAPAATARCVWSLSVGGNAEACVADHRDAETCRKDFREGGTAVFPFTLEISGICLMFCSFHEVSRSC